MIYRIYDNLHLGVLQIYEISFYRGNKEYQIPCQLIISNYSTLSLCYIKLIISIFSNYIIFCLVFQLVECNDFSYVKYNMLRRWNC